MLIQDQLSPLRAIRLGTLAMASLSMLSLVSNGNSGPATTFLPTGLNITPTAAPGSIYQALNPKLSDFPNFIASGALSTVKSPDGKTLLVLVSGHNSLTGTPPQQNERNEYIFVFDISAGTPVEKQIIKIPNSFVGIVFDHAGENFYVGGGVDDNVHQYTMTGGTWQETGTPISLLWISETETRH
jgi:hypothetical protein